MLLIVVATFLEASISPYLNRIRNDIDLYSVMDNIHLLISGVGEESFYRLYYLINRSTIRYSSILNYGIVGGFKHNPLDLILIKRVCKLNNSNNISTGYTLEIDNLSSIINYHTSTCISIDMHRYKERKKDKIIYKGIRYVEDMELYYIVTLSFIYGIQIISLKSVSNYILDNISNWNIKGSIRSLISTLELLKYLK